MVDRHDGRAGGEDGAVGERPLRARAAEDGDAVAGLDAQRDEPAREVADAPAEARRPASAAAGARDGPQRRAALALRRGEHHRAEGVVASRARSPAWAAAGVGWVMRRCCASAPRGHPRQPAPRAAVGRGWQAARGRLASADVPLGGARRDPPGPPLHPPSARRPAGAGHRALALSLIGLGVSDVAVAVDHVVPGTRVLARAAPRRSPVRPERARADPARGPRARSSTARARRSCARSAARPDTRVLSAWDARRRRRAAAPAARRGDDRRSVAQSEKDDGQDRARPQIERIVARDRQRPGAARPITGQPTHRPRACKTEAIDTTRSARGARRSPILFLVLLLLLRAPVAALGLTRLGAATAFAGFGADGAARQGHRRRPDRRRRRAR